MALAIWGDLVKCDFPVGNLAGSLFLSLFCHYSKHFYATQPEQVVVISSALKQ